MISYFCPADRPARLLQENEPSLMEHPVVLEVAQVHGCTPAQVLIRWGIQRGTSVIPKSVNPERLRQNFEAQFIELSEETMQKLAALDVHYRFINGRFWEAVGGVYTVANLWDE
ncbi:MAG: aldo/keto reductase [Microscillaceae bacterium]|nr:aldo/keto reductase [Microscillaceae bacterium]